MSNFITKIIPSRPKFYGIKNKLDYKAICVFSALGFFLDNDTFWTKLKLMPVASECKIDKDENLLSSKTYFKWHYEPRNISLEQATDEFIDLFETIIKEQTKGKNVILPLSGGLDSRTQAAALGNIGASVSAYSYSFCGGHNETKYSNEISKIQHFPFHQWRIKSEYLWNVIDRLAKINKCYSEFTHPRQMAFIDEYERLGEIFSLGHWGDVLFDDMRVPDNLPFDEQIKALLKKIIKKGGLELGKALWTAWGIEGDFEEYLTERVKSLHSAIDITDSANARIRAFKSLYWATRWTSVNLSTFESIKPVTLPYFDNRMCEFICTVPEEHLAGRKIQIEYLKRKAPKLAKITWQDHRPFNLYNYQWNKTPWNLPYRINNKAKVILNNNYFIQRNWELQFIGENNDKHLRERLFNESKFTEWIPQNLVQDFYKKFKTENPVYYSHSISMLLTLSLFCKHFK